MDKKVYFKMLSELCDIEEMQYALNCVDESTNGGHYWDCDGKPIKQTSWLEKSKEIVVEAEYRLSCCYEFGHVLNDCLINGNDEEKKDVRQIIKDIKKWLKKWKGK
jgi:hypothetical protein|tara:strand:+ start:5676 stop:5993 length:318 start_codon:yes stop_codon:yes gene_type:complete